MRSHAGGRYLKSKESVPTLSEIIHECRQQDQISSDIHAPNSRPLISEDNRLKTPLVPGNPEC